MGGELSKCCSNRADGGDRPFSSSTHIRMERYRRPQQQSELLLARETAIPGAEARFTTISSSPQTPDHLPWSVQQETQKVVANESPYAYGNSSDGTPPISLPRSIPRPSPSSLARSCSANTAVTDPLGYARQRVAEKPVAPFAPNHATSSAVGIPVTKRLSPRTGNRQDSSPGTVATRDASSINKNTMRDDEDLPLTPPALRRLRSAEPPTTASLSSTHPPSYTASPGSFDDGIASQRRTPRLDAFVRDATAMHRTSAMANLAEVDDMDDMEDDETGGPHEDDGYIAAQFTPAQVPSTAGDGLIPVARRDSTQSRASSIGAGELADDEDAGDSFEQDLQPVPVANPRGQGELRSALRGETPAVPRVQLVRPVKPRLTHARRTNANSLRAADARSRRKGPSGRQHRTRTSHRDRQQQQQQNTWDLIPLDPSPVPASVIAAEESLRRKWNAATLMC